jgi:hypothetical protein
MDSRKDLLFFSNYCDFCKKIADLIIKNNIRDRFIFVCVDNKSLTLPKFVNRVPMVFTYFKDIYADAAVIEYIESLLPKTSEPMNDDISPFALGTATISQYTYISKDGESYDTNMMDNNIYGILGMEQKISGPEVKNEDSSRTSKMDSSLFEKYINSRKNDDDAIKKMYNGANMQR